MLANVLYKRIAGQVGFEGATPSFAERSGVRTERQGKDKKTGKVSLFFQPYKVDALKRRIVIDPCVLKSENCRSHIVRAICEYIAKRVADARPPENESDEKPSAAQTLVAAWKKGGAPENDEEPERLGRLAGRVVQVPRSHREKPKNIKYSSLPDDWDEDVSEIALCKPVRQVREKHKRALSWFDIWVGMCREVLGACPAELPFDDTHDANDDEDVTIRADESVRVCKPRGSKWSRCKSGSLQVNLSAKQIEFKMAPACKVTGEKPAKHEASGEGVGLYDAKSWKAQLDAISKKFYPEKTKLPTVARMFVKQDKHGVIRFVVRKVRAKSAPQKAEKKIERPAPKRVGDTIYA